jgi:hypothetical protein
MPLTFNVETSVIGFGEIVTIGVKTFFSLIAVAL